MVELNGWTLGGIRPGYMAAKDRKAYPGAGLVGCGRNRSCRRSRKRRAGSSMR